MNTNTIRLITVTVAIVLTSLGSVSVAQAKQGADDTTPHASSSASATLGADDATPHATSATSSHRHTSHKPGGHRHASSHHTAAHQ